jgi:hypothetical protein
MKLQRLRCKNTGLQERIDWHTDQADWTDHKNFFVLLRRIDPYLACCHAMHVQEEYYKI